MMISFVLVHGFTRFIDNYYYMNNHFIGFLSLCESKLLTLFVESLIFPNKDIDIWSVTDISVFEVVKGVTILGKLWIVSIVVMNNLLTPFL